MRKNRRKSPLCKGKLNMLLLLCLVGALSLASCSKDNNDEPAQKTQSMMKLKSSLPAEITVYSNDGKSQAGTSSDVTNYFGKRLELAAPQTLLFKDDVLTIGKQYDLTESFKTKWEGNKLFLQNETTQQWIECGSKATNGSVTICMGCYRQEVNGSGRQLISFGQEYGLTSADKALASTSGATKVVWVKMNYTFE